MERKCKEVLHKDNYRAFFVEKYDNEVLFKMRRDTNRINFSVPIKEFETKYENMLEGESKCLEHSFCYRPTPTLCRVPGYGADEESDEFYTYSSPQIDYLAKIFISKKDGKLSFDYEYEKEER